MLITGPPFIAHYAHITWLNECMTHVYLQHTSWPSNLHPWSRCFKLRCGQCNVILLWISETSYWYHVQVILCSCVMHNNCIMLLHSPHCLKICMFTSSLYMNLVIILLHKQIWKSYYFPHKHYVSQRLLRWIQLFLRNMGDDPMDHNTSL